MRRVFRELARAKLYLSETSSNIDKEELHPSFVDFPPFRHIVFLANKKSYKLYVEGYIIDYRYGIA